MYPENDTEWEEHQITKVHQHEDGSWSVTRDDHWSFFVPSDSPVEPQMGMTARTYQRGNAIRGVFLNGQRVFYRTETEDAEHSEIRLYGADAADWLQRWDEGDTVWSIEMGGLGPGYEQAIQITVAELLRSMIDMQLDCSHWKQPDRWQADVELLRQSSFKNNRITSLGLSGAQFGAALNVAAQLFKRGPRALMKDPRVEDRKIQVSRHFPVVSS